MHSIKNLRRRSLAWTTGGLAALAMAGTAAATTGATAASASTASTASTASAAGPASSAAPARSGPFSFGLVPSPNIVSCLPRARGEATIIPGKLNDLMRVSVHGMPANSDFDLFVIETPNKPFGVSWYQTDIEADRNGNGSAIVQGIFDAETFSVSPGGSTTFSPTHQFHLGLWFNDPQLPFRLGCEPGATAPAVTPFNGEQHAGIQVLNTSEFPDSAGPLSHVHR
jgi:hypothetical protein